MESRQTKSHNELEQYHYQALKNPYYLMEGLADVMREDLMMNMPVTEPELVSPEEERVIIHVHRHSLDMKKRDWDLLQQTALRVKHLEKNFNQLKTKKKQVSKYG